MIIQLFFINITNYTGNRLDYIDYVYSHLTNCLLLVPILPIHGMGGFQILSIILQIAIVTIMITVKFQIPITTNESKLMDALVVQSKSWVVC